MRLIDIRSRTAKKCFIYMDMTCKNMFRDMVRKKFVKRTLEKI